MTPSSTDLSIINNVERIERFQSLQAGHYWRAKQAIIEKGITADEVLLIESIKWIDNTPHTIVLRAHPTKFGKNEEISLPEEEGGFRSKYIQHIHYKFLTNDFLDAFEFEPNHQQIRSEELLKVQGRINELQAELLDTQKNPQLLSLIVEEGLQQWRDEQLKNLTEPVAPSTLPAIIQPQAFVLGAGAIANAVDTKITVEGIAALKEAASREHQIATIKSKWIVSKTTEIAATIKAMTPFYEEQAAAALSQTEDVRTYVAKLMTGIESLDLYVGKNVHVETIRAGDSAPINEPLTILQKKLMMDEELVIWADLDDRFDYSKESLFFEALRQHDALVNQIFPTQRCILVMATTRQDIDYGDQMVSYFNNKKNKAVFLLIRDGDNIYRVFSPIESHLGSARLFPSKDDQDSVFRGFDGSQIKFEDVAYTDKVAKHELFALHYKRFLLLICGLDHRLKIFGEFYEEAQSLNFISLEFQQNYCRFIHDDDGTGMLPTEKRQSVQDWIKEKNSYLRSGSRVLCLWDELMNHNNAPSAFRTYNHGNDYHQSYYPTNELDVVIAYRSGNSTCVDIEIKGESSRSPYKERQFNCRVTLQGDGAQDYKERPRNRFRDSDVSGLSYLCLDNVSLEDLHWYIHNRAERKNYITYIRFFKSALRFIQDELKTEKDTRERLSQALLDGNLVLPKNTDSIVQQAVIAWRAANRGKALPVFNGESAPAEWSSLLDQMYMLAGNSAKQIKAVELFANSIGYEPLRLVLSGKAKLIVYVAPHNDECDNRIEKHYFVHKITLGIGKKGPQEKSREWAALPKLSASETTLNEWPLADEWLAPDRPLFAGFEQKQRVFAVPQKLKASLKPFLSSEPVELDVYWDAFNDWEDAQSAANENGKYIKHPILVVPFGLVYYPRVNELNYLCVSATNPHALLYHNAPEDSFKAGIRKHYIAKYYNKAIAAERFKKDIANPEKFVLVEILVSLARPDKSLFVSSLADSGSSQLYHSFFVDPSINHWYENWKTQVSSYAKTWIIDELINDAGVDLNTLLEVVIPDDYNPLYVFEFKGKNKGGVRGTAQHVRWFDICSIDSDPKVTADQDLFEWSREALLVPSLTVAREYVAGKGRGGWGGAFVRSTGALPDDVLERWVLEEK